MLDSLFDEDNETIPPLNSQTAVSEDAYMSTTIPEEAEKIFQGLEDGRKVVFQWPAQEPNPKYQNLSLFKILLVLKFKF